MSESWIGLPVTTPAGTPLGYVTALYASKTLSRTVCIVCADANEETFVVPMRAAKREQGQVVVSGARLKAPAGIPYPVGKPLFDRRGCFLGTIAALDPEHGAVTVRGGGLPLVLPVGRIAVGDVAVLRGKSGEDANSCKRMPKNVTCTSEMQQAVSSDGREDLPLRGLLGRRVVKSLASPTETVAEAGELVTADTLQRARRNNLLLALAADTLTDSKG